MENYTSTGFPRRNPFHIVSLPSLAKIWILAENHSRTKTHQKIIRLLLKKIGGFLFDLNSSSKGKFAFDGKSVLFNAKNSQFHSIYFPRYQYGYETETLILIDLLLTNSSGSFCDIGANWRHIALYTASLKNFTGSIHAYEPHPDSHQDLISIVTQLDLADRIYTHSVALSDQSGAASIDIPDGIHSGQATLQKNQNGNPVKTKLLDEEDIATPRLIKIDVEGSEAAVLRGAKKHFRTISLILFLKAGQTSKSPILPLNH